MAIGNFRPVAWTEGMFLRPQHFQHHDLFADERLRYHLHALNPFHWGVRELAIDEDALSDHRIEVLKLDAVMPGGTIIRYPGNALIETREFDPAVQRLGVHVGLRHLSPAEANAAPAGNGARDVRYVTEPDDLPDLNRGGSEAQIEQAFANLRIFLDGEEDDLEVHESFKLAELAATGDLKQPFALSPSYAPPLLATQAWAPLHDPVVKIVSQIAAKVRVVAGRTSNPSIADLPRMWMRYTLARMTPTLRHLLSTGETRPFDLYTALVETAGALAAFNMEEPAELPTYDHVDLKGCFDALIAFVDAQLDAAVPDRYHEIQLDYDPARKFYQTSELNTDLVDPNNHYFLGIKAALDSKELIQRVVEEGKAGSEGNVKAFMITNTMGLRLEHLVSPPTEIAARTGYEYFKVDPHSPKWAKVKDDFTFALALPKVETADVRLYVVTGGD